MREFAKDKGRLEDIIEYSNSKSYSTKYRITTANGYAVSFA